MSRFSAFAPGLGLALMLPLLLAGCGPKRDQFAPACPRPEFLGPAADLSEFRPSDHPGGGHDLTDLVLAGRVQAVAGKCKPGATAASVDAEARVTLRLTRGPAMTGNTAEVPYFLAVTEGSHILDKVVRTLRVTFPPNVDQVDVTGDAIPMVLPVSAEKSAAAYSILVGFQLTRDELEYNRSEQAQRLPQ